jgi:C_GCAxxG_C_C family probable redox protein
MDSSKAQIASERFAEGYNCAQAVMFAFSEDCGLSPDLALKAACGFGGGMGRKQEVCGAVTGAILVLSLRQGRGIQEGPAVTQDTYKSVREFMDAFAARNGSCICLDLLSGCDLMTEQGRLRFEEKGLSRKVCAGCVRSAAEILKAML